MSASSAACRSCGTSLPPGSPKFCPTCGATQIPPSEDPNIGTVVSDRYRLVRLLGEGASGRVYEGRQSVGRSERRVAVKVLRLQHKKSPRLVKRVEREVEIASSLAHPSTIRVFDFGETRDERPFVVMEFVDGMPLSAEIARGPLPFERALGIFSQVCGALTEAHERGIIHRDLKPENIMLMTVGGQRDLVKLLDFGIAKNISPDASERTAITEHGMIVGTPEYMSPEQFGAEPLGPASDIYSLGVIAYEVLSGQLPFAAEEVVEWAARHALDDPPPLETTEAGARVPEDARDAVLRALEKQPEARPPSAAAFYEALAAALPVGAPELGRASAIPRTPPPPPPTVVDDPDGGVDPTIPSELPPPDFSRKPAPTVPMGELARPDKRRGRTGKVLVTIALVAAVATASALAAFPELLGPKRTPPPLPPPPGQAPAPVELR